MIIRGAVGQMLTDEVLFSKIVGVADGTELLPVEKNAELVRLNDALGVAEGMLVLLPPGNDVVTVITLIVVEFSESDVLGVTEGMLVKFPLGKEVVIVIISIVVEFARIDELGVAEGMLVIFPPGKDVVTVITLIVVESSDTGDTLVDSPIGALVVPLLEGAGTLDEKEIRALVELSKVVFAVFVIPVEIPEFELGSAEVVTLFDTDGTENDAVVGSVAIETLEDDGLSGRFGTVEDLEASLVELVFKDVGGSTTVAVRTTTVVLGVTTLVPLNVVFNASELDLLELSVWRDSDLELVKEGRDEVVLPLEDGVALGSDELVEFDEGTITPLPPVELDMLEDLRNVPLRSPPEFVNGGPVDVVAKFGVGVGVTLEGAETDEFDEGMAELDIVEDLWKVPLRSPSELVNGGPVEVGVALGGTDVDEFEDGTMTPVLPVELNTAEDKLNLLV